MIFTSSLTIIENQSLINNDLNNYLLVYQDKLIHKPTGLLLYVSSDVNRLNQFVILWGYNGVFNFGITELTYLNDIIKLDDTHSLIIEDLILEFMNYNTTHPLHDILFLT